MLRYNHAMIHEDYVSIILAQWAAERPDLDASPMGIVGRISWLSLVVDKELEPVFAQFGLNHWSFDMLATLRRTGDPYRLSPTDLFRSMMVTFFFQAEDGIRYLTVTGVQTCALPI